MERSVSPALVAEIEDALSQVAEIRAARVVTGPDGTIAEIHVLALPSKLPKQLVRDIESTLMAAFGIAIDHKVISIAQLGQESVPEAHADTTTRAQILTVTCTGAGTHARVDVKLAIDGDAFEGSATGPASETSQRRLVAQATLTAIERYLQGAFTFALEDVGVTRLGRETVAVACVALVTGFGEQAYAGSALVRQNENDSIVRATLDAINRRLGFLTAS